MSVIGEAALSVFLELLGGKLLDSVLNFVADHKQLRPQLKQWQSILPDIQAVLDDAEEKQIKNEGVKKWLEDLQDLAYDVDDILDEFAYDELRLKLNKSQAQASTSKVRKLIPTCCTSSNFTPTSFLFKNSMIPKVKEITARLNSLTTRRSSLGLSEILSQAPTSKGKQPRLQPTSVLDGVVEYVGRHKEKTEMIEFLKGDNSNGVSVLSIVGMGGMGKTTLAQLAWVCVSDHFDAVNITRTILKSIDPDSRDENDLNLLQVKLKEKLSGKRFLLVLDDIWNENYDYWTILRSPLGAGTHIILTTRLQIVSSIVDPLKAFHLDKLSDDDCLSIFTQHALKARNFDGHLHFKEIGEKIVRRCNGIPLSIGSLLRTQCGIIPTLRLSYHHLPSYLKRCFAYCSILPKDYEFEEEEIILLWRAEGLLQQKAMPQIKDLGNQYFQDLVSRSFFQTSAQVVAGEICLKLEGDKKWKFSNRTRHSSYIVSGYDTVKKFEAFDQVNSLRTFLPLIFSSDYHRGPFLTNVVLVDLLPRLGCLRMLSLSGYKITKLPDVFENLKHLRYLNFSGTHIKCLRDSLCTLYHLETLLLRWCHWLQRLPSKMGNLVNLHYLDIKGAYLIERIPFRIDKLTNLQRLSDFIIAEGDGCHIRYLKYLSNLEGDFRLSGLENVNGKDAGEAKLNEKQGIHRLVLHWSEKFKKASRNKEVEEWVLDSLRSPKKLEQLVIQNYGESLRFGNMLNWEEWDLCEDDEQVSKFPSLRFLSIRECPLLLGRLPTIIQSLQTLEIYECQRLVVSISSFPLLCELRVEGCEELVDEESNFPHALKELRIGDCVNLQYLVDEKENNNKSMSSNTCLLERLKISNCPSLIWLSSRGDICNRLQHLEIESCSKLSRLFLNANIGIRGAEKIKSLPRGLDKLSHLQDIKLSRCPNLVSFEESGLPTTNLRVFAIENCENFRALPKCINNFTSLRELSVRGFPTNLTSLEITNAPKIYTSLVEWGFNRLTSLQKLNISGEGWSRVVSFPEETIGMMLPPSLTDISIQIFENLEFMCSKGLQHLTSLQQLGIYDCPKLASLPEKDVLLSLERLDIQRCPSLEEGCNRGKGREWSKISHIPYVQIDKNIVIPRH
ncbi:hypothetical protein ES319_D11G368800v1 [Gossypium barbadense]|uniref:Rx N-terminal domain-containing protein n=1 Tax=Gossypium barbadense TaxID=3634 RepID=A0A5J5PJX9_GOSBA|nr:hypothetical protein ES319_D11G368800v1 [Gossypium barbadense]